jgi:ubiquinone/menaquinone biosynthesis C-methylase UbiE
MGARVSHPVFARVYATLSPQAERAGVGAHRDETLDGLRGRVVEVGAGTGLSFGHYPPAVTEVVAVEPEPHMRGRAAQAASRAPVPVSVLDAVADELPLADASFDAAVVSLVLCTVPDQARALAELRRVVRPGGELRFYEHVVAEGARMAALQRGVDAWGIWPRLAGGCHAGRDTQAAIEAAGFEIERLRRFGHGPGPLTVPHVIGMARRPLDR